MIRNALRRFMYGRYGTDTLNNFLLAAYVVLYLLSLITRVRLFQTLGTVTLFLCLFRMLSHNHTKRRSENVWFMKKADPVLRWLRLRRTIYRDKDHVYFKCPNCAQQLRVPKGKGKITVTCRSCGAVFQEKS